MRLLVVEDEAVMAASIQQALVREGYAVDIAADGEQALFRAAVQYYDVVLLDRDLPLVHGDQVCQRLVADRNPARILMLTAAGEVEDLVEGFGLGADDYLAKPFRFAELVARVDALARRTAPTLSPVLEIADLVVDTARHEVTRGGRPIDLTPKEYGMLVELMRADGAVLSSEDLLDRVWDQYVDPMTNAVRVAMVTLRQKIGEPALISTVRGAGYRLAE